MAGREIRRTYGGIRARSLVLHWAAFFDQVGWGWSYRSHDLGGFAPTFRVVIPTLDSAWAAVADTRTPDRLVAAARRELERGRLEGFAVALGHGPLANDTVGLVAVYPRARWTTLPARRAGLPDELGALWREAADALQAAHVVDRPVTPEVYGGTLLPDWRSRGEALARRWGTPEQIRDWGLLISEIAQTDHLLAGILAGVSRARITDETLDVWVPLASLRRALLRSLGSRPREVIERCLHLQLQVLVEDP